MVRVKVLIVVGWSVQEKDIAIREPIWKHCINGRWRDLCP